MMQLAAAATASEKSPLESSRRPESRDTDLTDVEQGCGSGAFDRVVDPDPDLR